MMILSFFIACITFVLFSKSLHLKTLPPCASEMRLLTFCFWKESSLFTLSGLLINKSSISSILSKISSILASMKINTDSKSSVENDDTKIVAMSLLDLPELVLECILEKLPPEGLCSMASVSSSLRDRCISDYFWEKHMKQKWGGIIGPSAYREWLYHIATRNDTCGNTQGKQKEFFRYLISLLPFNWIRSTVEDGRELREFLPVDSIMSWYLDLESGRFRFPAQVYNRENGHVGFMLSCYDAELSYDSRTDTFQARYPPHGRREIAIENDVSCERIRAPPVDTPPHDLHISDCLNDLCPGDHIELQWRRNKEFPYGWWYGIVGHLELCEGNEIYCHCHNSGMVALEFNQYSPGSRWRRTMINRKDHTEEENETDGFYGGIRKLYNNEEISMWKRLWPTEVLE